MSVNRSRASDYIEAISSAIKTGTGITLNGALDGPGGWASLEVTKIQQAQTEGGAELTVQFAVNCHARI